jgi:probable phosphoglycerate mutase
MTATRSPGSGSPDLVLVRHGRTDWAHTGRHTGRTDVPLDDVGERQGAGIAALLEGRRFVAVVSSPLQRARRTAELAGLAVTAVDDDLQEWDYGGYEGLTTPEIRELTGTPWTVFGEGVVPGENSPGETLDEVAARCRRALDRVEPLLAQGDVAMVAHGHLLRILASVYLGLPPSTGAHLELDAGSVCELNVHHGVPTIQRWNLTPEVSPA